jgi:hypothetical protein
VWEASANVNEEEDSHQENNKNAKALYDELSPDASPFLKGGSRNNTVEGLLKATMSMVARQSNLDDGEISCDFMPGYEAVPRDERGKMKLASKYQTLLYNCVKKCNVEGMNLLLDAGAAPFAWSLSNDMVPELPLYFLAGKGGKHFPKDMRMTMFRRLLDETKNGNHPYGDRYTSRWAYGWADVDDSPFFNDIIHEKTDDKTNELICNVDPRHRKWSVMHQAAYWGNVDLLNVLLEDGGGTIADHYLHTVSNLKMNEQEDDHDDDRDCEVNFGRYTALHAAVMHSQSAMLADFVTKDEDRMSTTYNMVEEMMQYWPRDQDASEEAEEQAHLADCALCKKNGGVRFDEPDDFYLCNTALCPWYMDQGLLNNRYRLKTRSFENESAADMALSIEDFDTIALLDNRFESNTNPMCVVLDKTWKDKPADGYLDDVSDYDEEEPEEEEEEGGNG